MRWINFPQKWHSDSNNQISWKKNESFSFLFNTKNSSSAFFLLLNFIEKNASHFTSFCQDQMNEIKTGQMLTCTWHTLTHKKEFYLFFSVAITCNLFTFTCIHITYKKWMITTKNTFYMWMHEWFRFFSSFGKCIYVQTHEWINFAMLHFNLFFVYIFRQILKRNEKKNSLRHQYLKSFPSHTGRYRCTCECTSELIKI